MLGKKKVVFILLLFWCAKANVAKGKGVKVEWWILFADLPNVAWRAKCLSGKLRWVASVSRHFFWRAFAIGKGSWGLGDAAAAREGRNTKRTRNQVLKMIQTEQEEAITLNVISMLRLLRCMSGECVGVSLCSFLLFSATWSSRTASVPSFVCFIHFFSSVRTTRRNRFALRLYTHLFRSMHFKHVIYNLSFPFTTPPIFYSCYFLCWVHFFIGINQHFFYFTFIFLFFWSFEMHFTVFIIQKRLFFQLFYSFRSIQTLQREYLMLIILNSSTFN